MKDNVAVTSQHLGHALYAAASNVQATAKQDRTSVWKKEPRGFLCPGGEMAIQTAGGRGEGRGHWVIHFAFYALHGFRETPNLKADTISSILQGKCLKLGRGEENCVINHRYSHRRHKLAPRRRRRTLSTCFDVSVHRRRFQLLMTNATNVAVYHFPSAYFWA